MPRPIRVLFLADSHLGIDLPTRPRVARRRRGHDFIANHVAALAPALAGDIDLVVHGGDVFDRPRVSIALAHQAYQPMLRVAARDVPVFIVPGNHERGQLPHAHLLSHPRVHVFDRPRTFTAEVRGTRIALAGFPYERRHVRTRFGSILDATGWRSEAAGIRLLCVHHCVEGATVGPGDYTFTSAADVIRCGDLPAGVTAILSGHIHRHQVLTTDLGDTPLPAPVLYPGSIERTSTAEIGEDKGYMVLELDANGAGGIRWEFRQLPARPMIVRRIAAGADAHALDRAVRSVIADAAPDAVLKVRVEGSLTAAQLRVISPVHVRSYAPDSMNIEVRADELVRMRRVHAAAVPAAPARARDVNLELGL